MNFSKRTDALKLIIYGFSLVFVFYLFHIQVIQASFFTRLSERNRIRLISIPAPRGKILDRNGLFLATNRPAYHVCMIPEDFDPQDLPRLSKLLDVKKEELLKQIHVPRAQALAPVVLKRDVSKETAMQIEERKPSLAGVFIQIESIRYYPDRALNGHVLGYIGKVSMEEYQKLDHDIFRMDSYVGRGGIEKSYDALLRGDDGGRQVEVNARGEQLRILSEKKPIAGNDMVLSLDAALEKEVLANINEQKHPFSILAMDLSTGEIIALISHPNFDPNVFVAGGKDEERIRLLKDRSLPLINRATVGVYPPGSIFKLATSIAALETGKITRNTTFQCNGFFRLSSRSRPFKCWDADGHGAVSLYKALERSCNVYFYNVGRLVGEKDLSRYSKMLGLGEPAALEVTASSGVIPSADWKFSHFSDHWYLGETISFAIGQSYVLVTPLQILQLVAIVAKDGNVPKPTLIKNDGSRQGEWFHLPISRDTFKAVKQGMLRVVESQYGTGQLARIDFLRLAGKTGTAQAPPYEPHAWFAGFFPYENPRVALVVFVEHGGSGGLVAA
ncbi:MAG: penicillin-binding protein 2, partial [Candidatus Omnitrophica bacterium]|nr:penicillin-binding protein 2 [Candidatus Omnitrophota bacterium]